MAMDKEVLFAMSAEQLEDVKPLKEVFDLTGKVALVTGTMGLALHVINRLAEMGAKVVFVGRSEVVGELAEEELKDKGYDVAYFKGDASKVEDCYAIPIRNVPNN